MSALDGTTPQQEWDDELKHRYDSERCRSVELFESEIIEILEVRLKDLQELPHNHEVSDRLFDRIGEIRKVLSDIEEDVKKKAEKEQAKKKKSAKKNSQKKARKRPRKRSRARSEEDIGEDDERAVIPETKAAAAK